MSTLQQRKRIYGYIPDLADFRDRSAKVVAPAKLPASIHLDKQPAFQFPIYDQGQLGSCTANAIGAAFEYELRKQALAEFPPSRLGIYYGERKIEGTIQSDAGAMIRDGIKVIAKEGAAPEALWPYAVERFAQQPTPDYYTEAAKHRCVAYERVTQTEQAIKSALAGGHPIVFGISVYESFESETVATTGKVPMPKSGEQMLGGHAILMTGYTKTAVTFRNSWGVGWGKAGYATLPLKYVLDSDLTSDLWIVKVVE